MWSQTQTWVFLVLVDPWKFTHIDMLLFCTYFSSFNWKHRRVTSYPIWCSNGLAFTGLIGKISGRVNHALASVGQSLIFSAMTTGDTWGYLGIPGPLWLAVPVFRQRRGWNHDSFRDLSLILHIAVLCKVLTSKNSWIELEWVRWKVSKLMDCYTRCIFFWSFHEHALCMIASFLHGSRPCLCIFFCSVGFAAFSLPDDCGAKRLHWFHRLRYSLPKPVKSIRNVVSVPTVVTKQMTPLETELEAVEGISLQSRARFHPQLWQCFLDQSWPDKELVVVETYHNEPWKHCPLGLEIEICRDQTSSGWGPHRGCQAKCHQFAGLWSIQWARACFEQGALTSLPYSPGL